MSIYPAETLVEEVRAFSQRLHLERLRQHRTFLETLISHHYLWSKTTNNPDVTRMHTEVADLLQKASDKIAIILDTNQS